ncbi:MAG: hypothetical protein NC084_08240 [Bacteroides sp.]|nr:hypothetical protein [Eubacterium sp.]MCM1418631.1 hypothetical protein [Roseburia sp.]MCM1462685.1 hypothetical protein [Bacteroides sp.]
MKKFREKVSEIVPRVGLAVIVLLLIPAGLLAALIALVWRGSDKLAELIGGGGTM